MDKDTQFAILVLGVPFLGLLYCVLIFGTLIIFPWAREHPVIFATISVIAPSLISGSIWLKSALKGQNRQKMSSAE